MQKTKVTGSSLNQDRRQLARVYFARRSRGYWKRRRDADCLPENIEGKEAIKRECSVTNAGIGITSKNSRDKNSLCTQYTRKLFNIEKIKIGWTVSRVRMWIAPAKCLRCLDYEHMSATYQGPDKRTTCRSCRPPSEDLQRKRELCSLHGWWRVL